MTDTITNTPAPDLAPADLDSILAALASGERPQRPSALSAAFTHGWRALLKIKHVPEQLFDVTVFPVMMTLMFTFLFGGALAGSTKEYVQFFLPGIMVQSVIFITMYTGVGLNVDFEKGVFDRFRSLPMWRPSAIIGPLLGDAVRYSIAATVIVVLGLILGFRPDGGVVGVVAAIALLLVFAFSLSWIWTTFGLILRTEKSVMGVSMMLLFPLTFASNIFVDPSTMPGWLEWFVGINPISWLVTAVRNLMHGDASAGDVGKALAASAGFMVVFSPITMRLYRNKN